ncbi:hypothetical protein MMC17_006163 [Xylographa soralifera]|nr:hypothetical protein [Xylographa soralifera]
MDAPIALSSISIHQENPAQSTNNVREYIVPDHGLPRFKVRRFWPWKRIFSSSVDKGHAYQDIVKKLEDYPGGYPRFSAFLDSEEDLMIFRRFGTLHSRLLLHKQDQLRVLETTIEQMDAEDHRTVDARRYLMSREWNDRRVDDAMAMRKRVLEDVEQKLLEYGKLLLQTRQILALTKPSSYDVQNVWNYIGNEKPFVEAESLYILMKDDLVSLSPGTESALVNRFIEDFLSNLCE